MFYSHKTEERERRAGNGGAILTAQTETLDRRGNVTRVSTYTDAGAAAVWTVTETPESIRPAIRKTIAGRTVSMVSSTAVTNAYTFDGFGRQVSATDGKGNTTVTAHNDLGQVAYTGDAAGNRTSYAYDGLGRQIAVTGPLGNTTHTAYDSLGNVTDYINEQGATVAHREYGPFGETLAVSGPMADVFNFWFSTKYLHHETGLYYYGYRFYSPELMRWLNRDPIGEEGGVNEYGFVGNDPVNKNDVLGLACGWAVGKCTRALIIPSCPKQIMINGVPILVPDMVQQMVNSIPRLHHDDVKAVACTGKCSWGKCAGGTESVAVRGFFAKSMYDAVREKVLDLMGKSPSNGWVDGYVGYKEPGPCNLSCVSEQRYNQVIQRMNTLNPTRYKLTDYTCQTYASEVLAP